MNSDTILTLMDYLCNEARNAMHATFGLMEFYPEAEAGPAAPARIACWGPSTTCGNWWGARLRRLDRWKTWI
jgi:hypothetical protein